MLKQIITKKIGIIGYGLEGQNLVEFFIEQGAETIVVFDEKEVNGSLRRSKVEYRIGRLEDASYDGIDIFYRSPGIKRDRLDKILPEGSEVSSPTNLFFEIAQGKKIIITGTKGKSTTSNIIYQILKDNGIDVHLGGNIGNPLLSFVGKLNKDSYTVAELSSFQLQDFNGSADFYVFLPIKEDHLDYHKDFDEYFLSKKQAIANADKDSLIILPHDHLQKELLEGSEGRKYYYAREEVQSGCYLNNSDCVCSEGGDDSVLKGVGELSEKYKVPIDNILASIALSYKMELRIKIGDALEHFDKPKYRIEVIDTLSGMTFLNDSASTNPISTIEAINLISEPFILIMGGSSKNLDYSNLARSIEDNKVIRRILLFGETAEEIGKALEDVDYAGSVLSKNNLAQVFEDIVSNHKDVETILFSPASASFDQFKNYKDRGEAFDGFVEKYFK